MAPIVGSPGSFFPLPTEAAVSGPDNAGVPPTRYPVQVGIFDGTDVQRMAGDSSGRASVNVENFPAVQPVSAVALPLPAGASTEATLAAVGAAVLTRTKPTDLQSISAASLPLPAGASTEATLAAIKAKTDNLDVALSTRTKPADTQPVSAAALPLPTGASTEATLAAIKAKTDNLDVALSTRTKPADTQPVSAAALPLPAGASTEATLALIKAKTDNLDVALSTRTKPADTQPVSAAALPLPAGASTEATLALIKAKTDNLDVALSTRTKPADTQPVSIAALPALAAGTNLIGTSASPSETSTIYNGTAALTPKFAVIVASASGATTVVAAVTSKKIRVLRLSLVANAAVNVKFQSHATPTDKTGLYYLAANGGWVEPFCPVGIFETIGGEALDINLSGAVAVGGCLTYVEV
jgi:hypothetical protein